MITQALLDAGRIVEHRCESMVKAILKREEPASQGFERRSMSAKKPHPVDSGSGGPGKICPVCGEVSYSRAGIHPQCAVAQADAARKERLKAAKKFEKEKRAQESQRNKICPSCGAEVQARLKVCACGQAFGDKAT